MTVGAIGAAAPATTPVRPPAAGTSESKEIPGAADHDGDADDRGGAKAAAKPSPHVNVKA